MIHPNRLLHAVHLWMLLRVIEDTANLLRLLRNLIQIHWKSWMNCGVYSQMISKSIAFKPNNPERYKESIYKLGKVIKDAKWEFQTK